jgi:hypothetical protein
LHGILTFVHLGRGIGSHSPDDPRKTCKSEIVLDAKGVIRYIDAEGKELDRAVDALVRELESA